MKLLTFAFFLCAAGAFVVGHALLGLSLAAATASLILAEAQREVEDEEAEHAE